MFFKSKEILRIDKHLRLKPFCESLALMRSQQKYLASRSSAKYQIYTQIIENIDRAIQKFNQTPSQRHDLKDIGSLLIDIAITLTQLETDHYQILAQPRNNQRLNINRCMHYGLISSGAAVGAVFAGPALGLGAACGTGLFSYAMRSATGMSNMNTRSIKHLQDLIQKTETALFAIYHDLGYTKMGYSIEFSDEGKPEYDEMEEDVIYVYLNNGSIVYAQKNMVGNLSVVNLDGYLDKHALFPQDNQHYNNIDSLMFESYLETELNQKPNILEIQFNSLSKVQKTMLCAAVYKSLLKPCEIIPTKDYLAQDSTTSLSQ